MTDDMDMQLRRNEAKLNELRRRIEIQRRAIGYMETDLANQGEEVKRLELQASLICQRKDAFSAYEVELLARSGGPLSLETANQDVF